MSGPYVDVLEPYLTADDKSRLAAWEQYPRATNKSGHVSYNKGQHRYQRRLYTEAVEAAPSGYMAGFTGVKRQRAISPDVDRSSAARIADMDYEGADVNFMLPSGLVRHVHRRRRRGAGDGNVSRVPSLDGPLIVVPIPNGWVASCWSVRATSKAASRRCAAPDASAGPGACWSMRHTAHRSTCLRSIRSGQRRRNWIYPAVLHAFTVMPPYAPGGLDTWDNLWLQRSAAHPWCGMRNMAALIGSGLLDRFPRLRLGCLEAGHGWLPFWMARLDEHMETIRSALPPDLKHHPSEYVMGGPLLSEHRNVRRRERSPTWLPIS